MKNTLLLLTALILTFNVHAQKDKSIYMQKMEESLSEFSSCKSIEDYQSLSNTFSQIAQVENSEWLPLYYAANCKIIMSFKELEDKDKKDAFLDDAEKMLDKMMLINSEESEIYALEALCNTARLVVDPMTRGRSYSIKSNRSAKKSLSINAKNPRAQYIVLSNKIGFAKFFGKDISAECEKAKELLASWDDYKTSNSFAPKWGKNLVQEIVDTCE